MEIKFSNFIKESKKDIFDIIDEKVFELKKKGISVIDMGVGDTQKKFDPPQFVIDNLSKFAKEKKNAGYPGNKGQKDYLKSCSDYIKRNFNVVLDPIREMNITRGSKEGVYHFPMTLINPGDLAIVPTPGYPLFHQGVEGVYGEVYYVPLLEENHFLIDFESIPQDIVDRAKLIWINYPNSPTGAIAPREYLEKLVQWAHKNNIVIASDEGAYIDIYYEKKPVSILEITKKGVVAFYSLSKRNNMTGYRIGFVAGDEKLIDAFYKVKCLMDDGLPHFVQDVASMALNDDDFIKKMRDDYFIKRRIIMESFESIGCDKIQSKGSFFMWQKAPKNMDGFEFAEKLLEVGIVVIPGGVLSREVNGILPGVNFVRLALMISVEEAKEVSRRIQNEMIL